MSKYWKTILLAIWFLSQTIGFAVPAVPSLADKAVSHVSRLQLALFRPYDSDTGRWLSRDPIGEVGGHNLYRYAWNDPVNWFDPNGLSPCPQGAQGPLNSIGGGGNRPPRSPPVASSAGSEGEGEGWGPQKANAGKGAGERLALPGVRQVDYSWGALNTYREGGQMTAIEHINYRHAFESGFSDVSRFAQGTSVRDIQSFVDQASRYGKVTAQGANGFKIEYNLGRTIGTGQAGELASGIRVFIRNGQVQTAFPIALR